MILTKKGSTSSNIHLLAVIALILLVTRVIVGTIEKGIPQDKSYSVSWHEIPFVDAEGIKDYYKEKKEKSETTKEKKSANIESNQEDKKKKDSKESKETDSTISDISSKSKKYKRRVLQWKKLLPGNSQNKPIFILITSDENSLCQEFSKIVLTNKSVVQAIETKFFPIKLDLSKKLSESEAAIYRSSYTSTFIPSILIKDSHGKAIDRLVGSTDSIGLSAFLDKCLTKLEKRKNSSKKDELKNWNPHSFMNRSSSN